MFGLHCPPVRSVVAAPVLNMTLFFDRVRLLTASAQDDVPMPTIMSTPSWSYQRPATALATSALFWWSPTTSSTSIPGCEAVNSWIACFAQATPVGPTMSR